MYKEITQKDLMIKAHQQAKRDFYHSSNRERFCIYQNKMVAKKRYHELMGEAMKKLYSTHNVVTVYSPKEVVTARSISYLNEDMTAFYRKGGHYFSFVNGRGISS
jgi:hypothetical protein